MGVVLKLDFEKAYDKVNWDFLLDCHRKRGVNSKWCGWVSQILKNGTVSVKINNTTGPYFQSHKGVRQGDPLSPYLFLICAEALSNMLQVEENNGTLIWVKVCREAPQISHLLFADDSLILMRADGPNVACLRRVLDDYCTSSSQLVSEAKSSIYFSPNTPVEEKVVICQQLNINTEALNDEYLGLPSMVGTDRSDSFEYLIDRVNQVMIGWKEKLLSTGGKATLIKVVAQAMPVFAMSVFKIPKKICKGMTDAISKYWWGDDDNHKRIHWAAWWKVCIPKERGGLGFRDLHSFNLALLAKQVWRLLENPDSLCSQVLRAKYYLDGKLLDAKVKSGSSYTWQSIWAGINTLGRGAIWRIGDGSQVNIWTDSWIQSSDDGRVITPRGGTLLSNV